MSEFAAASAFEEATRARAADRVVPFSYGDVVITDSLPSVHDLNVLRVERAPGAEAAALVAEAERIQGGAGLRHRRVVVLDTAEARRLEPGFRELGWDVERLVFMVRRRPAERTADIRRVVEVDAQTMRQFRERALRAEPGRAENVVAQLVEAAVRLAAAGRARHFAVVEDGAFVSAADLYSDGELAQIEYVETLPEHRGRGHGTAVTLRAADEAARVAPGFTFLVAEGDDWPKHLYARLGFDEVGEKYLFVRRTARERLERTPPEDRAS